MIASTKVQVRGVRKWPGSFELVNRSKLFILSIAHVAPSRCAVIALTQDADISQLPIVLNRNVFINQQFGQTNLWICQDKSLCQGLSRFIRTNNQIHANVRCRGLFRDDRNGKNGSSS
ncbi:hypothetical protein BGV70_26580 [Burkholderia ubonensis]|nr:hypothetical protein WJ29_19030 [Burkholderia ubonensis]KVW29026.1 hypothetical protein WK93_10320 [Burkholderia ubonensis]OJA62638.1 hypothetical protein BGV70_26580 [Burkholderia ubonensis]